MHQFEQFEQLIRRVGYSVGLEEVVDRVEILVDSYSANRDMNLGLWKSIVQEKYNRKISDELQERTWVGARKSKKTLGAEDHFANFYGQLNLLSKVNNQVLPMFGLDVLSILKENIQNEFRTSLEIILTLYLLEADGDILLNCILGEFENTSVAEKIGEMFEHKKAVYFRAFTSRHARDKIEDIFTVQSGESQKDDVPSKYLKKVIPSRSGWYEQLRLRDRISSSALHSFLTKQGILVEGKFCAFFAYSEEEYWSVRDGEIRILRIP